MNEKRTIDKREMWDRLVLLLIAVPREGWEEEFKEIARREIGRLAPLNVEEEEAREPEVDQR
jgi:hypothetical protein